VSSGLALPKLGAKYEKSPKSTFPLESKADQEEIGVTTSTTTLPNVRAKKKKKQKKKKKKKKKSPEQ